MDLNQSGSKSHDWPWSSIVWLLCGSSFVSSFFLGWKFSKNLSPFLYYSFCLLLCSILLASSSWFIYGASLGFLWDFHHNSMKFLWCFYGISKGVHGISMGFLQDFKGASTGFPLDSLGISLGILWDFHDISIFETTMRFKQIFYGISMEIYGILDWIPMGLLSHPYRISIMFLWYFYGITMESLWDFHGILLDFYDITMGFKNGSYGISMMFLWYFYGISAGILWDC